MDRHLFGKACSMGFIPMVENRIMYLGTLGLLIKCINYIANLIGESYNDQHGKG